MFNPQDFYFKKAKTQGYKARSVFKLEEIDKKYKIFSSKPLAVLDIWCAPWSWLQYIDKVTNPKSKIIWLDLKGVKISSPKIKTYVQDATKVDDIEKILQENNINKLDIITSDMAPNTIWVKDIDAIRSIELVKSTLPIYEKFLKQDWKFVIKVFMGPWFDELVESLKKTYWWKNIKVFKPQATRKISKEIYIIKYL